VSSFDREVAELSARQYGVFSVDELRALGLSNRMIQSWCRQGRIVRIHRGVYQLGGVARTWESRLLAACKATDGVASHRSAAMVWGFHTARAARPEVLVANHRRIRCEGAVVHRSTNLPGGDIVYRHSIPVTTPTRTLVDIGAVAPVEDVEALMYEVINRQLATWPAVLRTFLHHARRGRDGCGSLRAVLDEHYGARPTESTLEQRVERLLIESGLPAPVRQIDVADDQGFVMRLDFGFPEQLVALEIDSTTYHLNRQAFEADRRKRNRLRLLGWLLLEITADMVRDQPVLTVSQVRSALVARGWSPSGILVPKRPSR
jgi:hypothetical protein